EYTALFARLCAAKNATRTAKSRATMKRIRRGVRRAVALDSAPATASGQAHGVDGDPAPHDDIRGDDEAEVLGHDRSASMRCCFARSRSMRSARNAKYTNVNAATATMSVRLIDGSSEGEPEVGGRSTVGSW